MNKQSMEEITDLEAAWILREINKLSLQLVGNAPLVLMEEWDEQIDNWIDYLAKRGRYAMRAESPGAVHDVYVFVENASTDAEQILFGERIERPTHPLTADKDLEKFEKEVRALKFSLPNSATPYNVAVKSFVSWLYSLGNERAIETLGYIIDLLRRKVRGE